MHAHWPVSHFAQMPVMIRALQGITKQQIGIINITLQSGPGGWVVDEHDDYNGYASVVATHEATGACFSISGTAGQIAVSEFRDDKMRACGEFDRIDAALACLTQRVIG